MTQKITKIIIFALGLIIIFTVFLFMLHQVSLNPQQLQSKLVQQCESELAKQSTDFQVCKISENKLNFLTESNLDTEIRPSDKFIISLNLPRLFSNYLTDPSNQVLAKNTSSEDSISVCFVLYPVLVPFHLGNPSNFNVPQQEVDRLSQQYLDEFKWSSTTALELDQVRDGSNIVCSKPFKITEGKIVSFNFSLPKLDFFHLVIMQRGYIDMDIQQYGVKVLLAGSDFTNNQNSSVRIDVENNIEQNYAQMVPMGIFKHQINTTNF
jgi:hypothetical protein